MLAVPLFAAWFLIQSPHFELVTDTDEKSGRQVLIELENVRLALAGPYGTPLPVRCFLFRREQEFANYRPTPITRAFFQSGPDRDYIVTALNSEGKVPRESLVHEYVHLYLNHVTKPLPKWADEGLAEYYSTIRFSAGKAEVGLPVSRHQTVLTRGKWLDATEMAAVTSDSPEYSEAGSASQFYAQAWAAAYVYASTAQGKPSLLPDGFSPEQLTTYLQRYRSGAKPAVFPWPLDQVSPIVEARPIDDTNAALFQVDLLLRLAKHVTARGLLEELERRAPRSAVVERGLALIAADRGDQSTAVQHFERAIQSSETDADSFFEYAVYLENLAGRRDQRDRITALLAEATRRNPNHAEAQFLQGRMLVRAGRQTEAIPYFERAASILPREPLFAAALESSRQVVKSAPHSGAGTNPANVRVPESWTMPTGDTKLTGQLQQVDCSGNAAKLHILSQGTVRTFQVHSSDRIQIQGPTGAQIELTCGAQRDHPKIEVEFSRQSGNIAAIFFVTQ